MRTREWTATAGKSGSLEVDAGARHHWAGVVSTNAPITIAVWAVTPKVGPVPLASQAVPAGRHQIPGLPVGTIGAERLRVTMSVVGDDSAKGAISLTWVES